MGTITRGAKAGGGTGFNAGQTIDPTEVNTDFNTIYTEINALLDDGNIETATIPGAKSLRFTEISAPANPSANDALLYAIDETATTRLVYRDSAGTVTYIGSLGARVYNSANLSIANNTITALTFDSERYDTSAMHSTASNTSRITPGIAGKYLVWGGVRFDANATGARVLGLRIDGATVIGQIEQLGSATTNVNTKTVSAIYAFTATTYVELIVSQDSGGALNVLAAGNASPEFAIAYLGA